MPISRRTILVGTAAIATTTTAAAVITASRTTSLRPVRQVVVGTAHIDGAGVSLTKLLGGRALAMLDPFLMLDGFHSNNPRDFQAGFPSHPHRGFETVTIMLDGQVEHKDSVGNRGIITGGGLQWMTAGRGIVHSEMLQASPTTRDMWGFQLWVNLPASEKMKAPRYQDMAASTVPSVDVDDGHARVLAGVVGNTRGPIDGVSMNPIALDIRIPARGRVRHPVAGDHNAFAVVAAGRASFGDGTPHDVNTLVAFGAGDTIELHAGDAEARVMLFAGRPIGEPVARRGPFVMNTDAEIRQAYDDYRSGRLVGG